MDAIALKIFVLGELYDNCYLVFDKNTRKGFIVDAPEGAGAAINDFIRKEKIDLSFVVLTHAHFDHIAGLSELELPFYLHPDDAPLLENANLNGSCFFSTAVIVKKEPNFLNEDKPLFLGEHKIKCIHTPGHTPGSVSLHLENLLFSGDTLFANSIGRTDIPLASSEVLLRSIKEKLLVLPKDTIVYPGHGSSTTVGKELKFNPYLV